MLKAKEIEQIIDQAESLVRWWSTLKQQPDPDAMTKGMIAGIAVSINFFVDILQKAFPWKTKEEIAKGLTNMRYQRGSNRRTMLMNAILARKEKGNEKNRQLVDAS